MDEAGSEEAGGMGRNLGRVVPDIEIRIDAGPVIILALALLVFAVCLFSGEFPRGSDTWGHIAKVEYLAEQMHAEGLEAYFTTSWFPNWYMGDPFRTYYPPLTVLVLTPFVYLLRDVVLAYRLFVLLLVGAFGLLSFAYLKQQWGRWPAALGAVMAIWAPYQLRTIFFEGNLPRGLAVLALPAIALCTDRLLSGPKRRATWVVFLALTWSWALLAHPQQAYMFAICFAFYLVARLFLDVTLPIRALAIWGCGLVLGLALAAPWIFPAYVGNEIPGVPYLPPEKVPLFSAPLRGLFPAINLSDGRIAFGFGGIFLAILAVVARPDPRRNAWLAVGFAGLWLSLGPKGVAFGLLPLSGQLLPERFLNFSAFAFPMAAAGLLPIRNRAKLFRSAVVAGMVLIDALPAAGLIPGGDFPGSLAQVQSAVEASLHEDARLALMNYPEPNALETYFTGDVAQLINGWALENTPHHARLRRYLNAAAWSPAYLERLFGLWDVRQMLLRGPNRVVEAVRDAMPGMGFELEEEMPSGYELWRDDRQAAPVQQLPPERMLAVGDRIQPMLMAFPFAEEAVTRRVSQISAEEFNDYPVIALYRFEDTDFDLAQVEAQIRAYVESGGTVILELSGMEEAFGRALDFLDVDVLRLSVMGDTRLEWAPELQELTSVLDLSSYSPQGWSGATYNGLDDVIARVEVNDRWYPFIGYREIGEGKAWFIGFNLFYYAQLSGDRSLTEAMQDLVLADSTISRDLRYRPIPIRDWQVGPNGISFTSLSPKPVDEALISYTYSPRWRVLIDGEEAPLDSFERMIKLSLPAGEHAVQIEYQTFGTRWPSIGLGVAFLGVLACGLLFPIDRWWRERSKLDQGEAQEIGEHAPCANCGFVLAEVGPPTPMTYPFKAVRCPICGMRMDDSGFEPGENLSERELREALARWLDGFGHDLEQVESKGGIGFEDYFTAAEGSGDMDSLY